MKVLVACEFSGIVREAFRARGHDAWSCDVLPTEISGNHFQGSIFHVLSSTLSWRWDLIIAHPPCTYLSNSRVRWLWNKDGSKNVERWEKMKEAAIFFRSLLFANCDKVVIENPVIHKYAKEIIGRKQDQVIQPYQFGHTEQKATCLWLKGVPPLQPTNDVKNEMKQLPKNQQQRLFHLPPSADRAKERSKTFAGIAAAFAEQWG